MRLQRNRVVKSLAGQDTSARHGRAADAGGITPLLARLASTDTLEAAFDWLKRQRADLSPDNEIWSFRRNRDAERNAVQIALRQGVYEFSPLLRYRGHADQPGIDQWSARAAVVIKALQLVLAEMLPVHPSCTHVRGHGGLKRAVREAAAALGQHPGGSAHVMRTDVKSYYASIDHGLLLDRLAGPVRDRAVLNLVSRFLRRSVEFGGTFEDYDRGISRGCALSPLLGAFYLGELDAALERQPVFAIRYMDDILIVASNRHKLRRAVATVNRIFTGLGLCQHPDKTFIGRASRGFEFLGYRFGFDDAGGVRLGLAKKTITNFRTKLSRLYEQGRRAGTDRHAVEARGDTYVRRWLGWVFGGLEQKSGILSLVGLVVADSTVVPTA